MQALVLFSCLQYYNTVLCLNLKTFANVNKKFNEDYGPVGHGAA